MLTILGQRALSDFRISQRLRELRRAEPAVTDLSADFVYFIDTSRDLDPQERDVLHAMLDARRDLSSLGHAGRSAFVVPRLGTISPWSTKATDIAHACGLEGVRRIERGIRYQWELAGEPSDVGQGFAAQLYDRMTESWLSQAPLAQELFAVHEPDPLQKIELGSEPFQALAKANKDLGLALSDDEIDYLASHYSAMQRDPSDAELMMFAQANSEHCRHKVFNADWQVDGKPTPNTLFGMIRNTTRQSGEGVLSAYSDNAAVVQGPIAARLMCTPGSRDYSYAQEPVHLLMKVETHNHPTAIAPFAGAATGAGGEIRDEGATGLGAVPKAGLTGFSVSHLRIPNFEQDWELDTGKPERIVSALQIMLQGPLGGAAFNNEFGRPNLCGYFRSFESQGEDEGQSYGYHKPIMIAGGMGNVREEHACKIDVEAGVLLVVLGGPSMLIGLGGGAASSLSSGESDEDLDFASVQRGNPEMQRRAQEVINRCWEQGSHNPIVLIHDVGAGGLSNAVPEAVDHSSLGGRFELRAIPNDEPGMSPMALWCNESQERYVLLLKPERLEEFEAIAQRERCPMAVLGELDDSGQLRVDDQHFQQPAVDLPMEVLLGKTPKMKRAFHTREHLTASAAYDLTDVEKAIRDVLRHPTVADKSFLIHIGDRSVGGLTARDQLVGPWQVPVSDVAVTSTTHESISGEAMAMGERTPLAIRNAPASGRMAVAESLTNIAAADFGSIANIRLSANWMAAMGAADQDQAIFETVRAVGLELCPALGIAIPVGKDSLSMRSQWQESEQAREVTSPLSLIVTAFSPVGDVRKTLTPELKDCEGGSDLLLLDLSQGRNRLGGSVLSEVCTGEFGDCPDLDDAASLKAFMQFIDAARSESLLLAYHDRSDGGLIACLAEMSFASRLGFEITLDSSSPQAMTAALFAEELGAVVQIARAQRTQVDALLDRFNLTGHAVYLGSVNSSENLSIKAAGQKLELDRTELHREWSAVSYQMQSLRDNPVTAKAAYDQILDREDPGLSAVRWDGTFRTVNRAGAEKPSVAILREQGVNSQNEMAAAFLRAGFRAVDVHMSDLAQGRDSLANYQGLVACGGFSFGDVLGAGGGWAKSILFNPAMRDQFAEFFENRDKFSLGVCNGCQMLSGLSTLIPGAQHWPRFEVNESEQFEARLSLLELESSNSLFFSGMQGQRLPIANSHGEGRARFVSADALNACEQSGMIAARFIDGYGNRAETYPANPNGSDAAVCALSSADGRSTIIMPHPERVARTLNNSWHPSHWPEEGPWMQMFYNAFAACR